jgi:NAD(P)-dependent dehydrogenase (short-subunit alcohol dehydrogenase family)
MSQKNLLVIVGAGGMGISIARRLGSGRHIFLADYSLPTLKKAEKTLLEDGHSVSTHVLDVTSYSGVLSSAQIAKELGTIEILVHTAGVAPGVSTARQILEIDLLGTANVLDAFVEVVEKGTSVVCIASMAGSMIPLSAKIEKHLALSPLNNLLQHQDISIHLDKGHEGVGMAYAIAKRGNQLRVQAASIKYGMKGARVNSVSYEYGVGAATVAGRGRG